MQAHARPDIRGGVTLGQHQLDDPGIEAVVLAVRQYRIETCLAFRRDRIAPQRRGLGLDVSAPDRARRYVVGVDTETNTVLVGPPALLDVDSISADHAVWCGAAPALGTQVAAQVRAHGEVVNATLVSCEPMLSPTGVRNAADAGGSGSNESVTVSLSQPLRGVAPGQALALYDGTRVIGSATITRAWRAQA